MGSDPGLSHSFGMNMVAMVPVQSGLFCIVSVPLHISASRFWMFSMAVWG